MQLYALVTRSLGRSTQGRQALPNGKKHHTRSLGWELILYHYRNESYICAASLLTPKCYVWIHDHKTLGKDKEIGEGEIDVRLSSGHMFVRTLVYLCIRSGVTSNLKASQLPKLLLNSNLRACSGYASNSMQTPILTFPTARLLFTLLQTDVLRLLPHRASVCEAVALMMTTNSLFPGNFS